MKELVDGIMNFFKAATSDNFYTTLSGRLYFQDAPQDPTFPYATFFIVSAVPEYYFDESPRIEEYLVQFNMYSNKTNALEVENLEKYNISLFHNAVITVSGYTLISFEWQTGRPKMPEDKDHLKVQHRINEFQVFIEK